MDDHRRFLGGFMIVTAVVIALWIPLAHPDLTQTRLFLTFWPWWLGVLVLAVVGAWQMGVGRG